MPKKDKAPTAEQVAELMGVEAEKQFDVYIEVRVLSNLFQCFGVFLFF